MIRLMVCDDHDLVRTSLVRALQAHADLAVVAEASGPEEVLQQLPGAAVDVLLLDLSLGSGAVTAGLDLLHRLQAQPSPPPVLVVSMHNEPELVSQALQAGARGYVTKDSSLEVLIGAIADVHQGRSYLSPQLQDGQAAGPERRPGWYAALTPREREVMGLICGGRRMRDIALSLGLSIKTVSTHKVRLMTKLGVASNADLIKFGLRHGL